MDLIFSIALTLTVFLVLAMLLAPVILRPSPAARRILQMVRSNRPDERNIGTQERMQEAILSMARGLRLKFGLVVDERVKQQLLSAGIRSSRGVNAYFVSRFVGPVLGLVCGSLIRTNTVFWALTLAAVFYLIPDMWLKMKIRKRNERIRKSLPDALDLLVICVEAGLGLDQAMLRVGQELNISHPDIHYEFMQVNFEQLAGKPGWRHGRARPSVPRFRSSRCLSAC
jgi:tight adherence protein C